MLIAVDAVLELVDLVEPVDSVELVDLVEPVKAEVERQVISGDRRLGSAAGRSGRKKCRTR